MQTKKHIERRAITLARIINCLLIDLKSEITGFRPQRTPKRLQADGTNTSLLHPESDIVQPRQGSADI